MPKDSIKKVAVKDSEDTGGPYVPGSVGAVKYMAQYVPGTYGQADAQVRISIFEYYDTANPKVSTNIKYVNTTFTGTDGQTAAGITLPATEATV